jgi:transposase
MMGVFACRIMPPNGRRAVALGRKNWTFAGSDDGGRRTAALYTLIATGKLN